MDVVSWHPNGHYLATGSSDHTLRLWDMRSGEAQRILIGHRAAVSIAVQEYTLLLQTTDFAQTVSTTYALQGIAQDICTRLE